MRVRVTDATGTHELPLLIEPDTVMCGGGWHPGVAFAPDVPLEPFTAEWVCYAINEGGALFAEADNMNDQCPVLRFVVVSASSDELNQLQAINGAGPEGAYFRLSDGREFWSRFGRLTGGNDEQYASMAGLDANFDMDVPLTPHILAAERMITHQAIIAKLADVSGDVSIVNGTAHFEDGTSLSLAGVLEMPNELRAQIGSPVAVNVAYLPPRPADPSPLREFFDRLSRAMVRDNAVLTIGERKYRYARVEEAFEDGDFEHTPAATGVFVRNPVTCQGDPDSFRWMYLCSDGDLDQVLRPEIEAMTDAQRAEVLLNLTFSAVLRSSEPKRTRPRPGG